MYSTTDECLLSRGFTGPGWQRAKVSAPQPSRQTGQRQASVFHPQFFSGGLFTANPLGLTGAAGQVSNAAPPLRKARVFGSIMEADKGARRCLLCLRSHSCWVDPDPWHRTIGSEAGRSLAQFDGQVSCCSACCHYSLPWLDAHTMALAVMTSTTHVHAHCNDLPRLFVSVPFSLSQLFNPTSACPKSPSSLFCKCGQCLWIKSTLNMSHSTWYLSLSWLDFLTELKPYFTLNEGTLLLFKLSIQTLATSPNRYAAGIPGSTANSSYLVKGISAALSFSQECGMAELLTKSDSVDKVCV